MLFTEMLELASLHDELGNHWRQISRFCTCNLFSGLITETTGGNEKGLETGRAGGGRKSSKDL